MKPVFVLTALCLSLTALAGGGPETAEYEEESAEAERIYNQTCVVCHGTGVEGAPRTGEPTDWAPRLAYGIEELYISTLQGLPPSMPVRGLCNDCSDEQLKAVVDYMLSELE